MEKRNTVLLTVIAVATLLVAVVGATFAYFSASVQEVNKTETKLKAAELGITFTGTQDIEDYSIEPGWNANKVFTVANTSDYDMTFDINFTNVVNNFVGYEDLTYSVSAVYSASTNSSYTAYVDDSNPGTTVQMVGLNESKVAEATKTPFSATDTLPVDGSVSEEGTITYGTNVTKVARVFIPAHTTEKFTMNFDYAYLETSQNVDQGKVFRTTVTVTANGIDAGSLRN